MRLLHPVICLPIAALFATAAISPLARAAPDESREQVAIIDQSSSMSAIALDAEHPLWSRLDVTKAVFPIWLNRLPQGIRVGLVTVGGMCGNSPALEHPVGTDRNALARDVAGLALDGQTPLNQVLESVPRMFTKARAEKRVVLFTDGLDSCGGDTCEIARQLYQRHGIVVDVVVLGRGDRELSLTAQCISSATTGQIIELSTTTQVVRELTGAPPAATTNTPPPSTTPVSRTSTDISIHVTTTLTSWFAGLVWWHVLIAAAGIAGALSCARVVYKHLFHAAGWATSSSLITATMFALSSGLTLLVALFTGATWLAFLFGLLTLALMLITVTRPTKAGKSEPTDTAQSVGTF